MNDLLAANQSTGSPSNWPALIVTAVVSIVVSVGSAWLIFQLVKKREMAEGLRIELEKLELVKKPELARVLLNEIEGQREKLRLEQEKDRNEFVLRYFVGRIRFLVPSKTCTGGSITFYVKWAISR